MRSCEAPLGTSQNQSITPLVLPSLGGCWEWEGAPCGAGLRGVGLGAWRGLEGQDSERGGAR